MLSHIAVSLPHCVGTYNNILPLYTHRDVPVYHDNEVRHVDIITYFAMCNKMHLARHLLSQVLGNMPDMDLKLLTADQIFELFTNFNYKPDHAYELLGMLVGISYERLNPLVTSLLTMTLANDINIPGYYHITKHVPDLDDGEDYDICRAYNNYPEAEYLLSLIEPESRQEDCEQVFESYDVNFNTADIRYLKLLVDNCKDITNRYYSLAYALVYDKFTGMPDGSLIMQFLYKIYNNKNVRSTDYFDDIVYLERLLTSPNRKLALYKVISTTTLPFPSNLPPLVHKQVAKCCVKKGKDIKLTLDNCKYCRCMVKL